jgi:hypothetical protein
MFHRFWSGGAAFGWSDGRVPDRWKKERVMSNDQKISTVAVSNEHIEVLVRELSRRLMLITPETINHLQSHGVIPVNGIDPALLRADGCCKPDGGTCCPNKKFVESPVASTRE